MCISEFKLCAVSFQDIMLLHTPGVIAFSVTQLLKSGIPECRFFEYPCTSSSIHLHNAISKHFTLLMLFNPCGLCVTSDTWLAGCVSDCASWMDIFMCSVNIVCACMRHGRVHGWYVHRTAEAGEA